MHDYYKNTPQYFLETAEKAALLPREGFFAWLFHSPQKYALPESARYLYPDRSGEDLVAAYTTLLATEKEQISKKDKNERLFAIAGCMIRSRVKIVKRKYHRYKVQKRFHCKVKKGPSIRYIGPNFGNFFLKGSHYKVQWSVESRKNKTIILTTFHEKSS